MAGGFLPAEPQWKPKNTEVGSLSPLPKKSNPGFLPDPGIDVGSSALQADSLPAEPSGKPNLPSACYEPP